MRIYTSFTLGIVIICYGVLLYADTYQWEDDQGGVHFTDNADTIPAKYRKKVQRRESMQSEAGPATSAPTPVNNQQNPTIGATNAESGSQSASVWRERFALLKHNLTVVLHERADKQEALQRAHRAYVISLDSSRIKDDKDDKTKSYALNSIGAKRKAYFDLQEDVRVLDEKVREIEAKLASLQTEADAATVPADQR